MINEGLIAATKLVGGFVVSSGVSTMVGFAAKSSVPKIAPLALRHIPIASKGFHLFQKVAIPVGAFALAGMASEQAVNYFDREVDTVVTDIEKYQKGVEEAVALAKAKAANKK
jgi:hypothetical protein